METVARAYAQQAGYTFQGKVGSGAFKETFLVSDSSGQIALKILGPNCSTVRTEREIEALHGMGPKALGLLRDALQELGPSLT